MNNNRYGGGTPLITEKGGQALTCSPFRLPKKGGLRCEEVILRG